VPQKSVPEVNLRDLTLIRQESKGVKDVVRVPLVDQAHPELFYLPRLVDQVKQISDQSARLVEVKGCLLG